MQNWRFQMAHQVLFFRIVFLRQVIKNASRATDTENKCTNSTMLETPNSQTSSARNANTIQNQTENYCASGKFWSAGLSPDSLLGPLPRPLTSPWLGLSCPCLHLRQSMWVRKNRQLSFFGCEANIDRCSQEEGKKIRRPPFRGCH